MDATEKRIFGKLQLLAGEVAPFELPDALPGFNQKQLRRALTEFKKRGLISVKRRRGKLPLITMLATRAEQQLVS